MGRHPHPWWAWTYSRRAVERGAGYSLPGNARAGPTGTRSAGPLWQDQSQARTGRSVVVSLLRGLPDAGQLNDVTLDGGQDIVPEPPWPLPGGQPADLGIFIPGERHIWPCLAAAWRQQGGAGVSPGPALLGPNA